MSLFRSAIPNAPLPPSSQQSVALPASPMVKAKWVFVAATLLYLQMSFLKISFRLRIPGWDTPELPPLTFSDLQLVRLVGSGYISYGFEARLRNATIPVIAKITGDKYIQDSDIEINMLQILNRPPTSPHIPSLLMSIHSMPNVFTEKDRNYLLDTLGMSRDGASEMIGFTNISVIVTPFLTGKRKPASMPECQRFVRSFLHGLEFTHSRNVINNDLHGGNLYWDGKIATLFDWNGGSVFRPNAVKMHITGLSSDLVPPEGWKNKSALHQTASAFDIFSVGVWVEKWIRRNRKKQKSPEDIASFERSLKLAEDFIDYAHTEDPFIRPTASELLRHDFLKD